LMCFWAHGDAPVDRPHAAHSCGNPTCVNPAHLRWASPSENMMDRLVHGTDNRGENSANAKLTEAEVIEIRTMKGVHNSGVVARKFGVRAEAIQKIWRGDRWGWL
jgi:hypothetical protein